MLDMCLCVSFLFHSSTHSLVIYGVLGSRPFTASGVVMSIKLNMVVLSLRNCSDLGLRVAGCNQILGLGLGPSKVSRKLFLRAGLSLEVSPSRQN